MSILMKNLPTPTSVETRTIINIDEDGVSHPYLYLGLKPDGKPWVIRLRTFNNASRMNNTNIAQYNTSECDSILNNESTGFKSKFDQSTQNCLSPTSIICKSVDSAGNISYYEIARSIFLLSYTEAGYNNSGLEGASIKNVLALSPDIALTSQTDARTTLDDNSMLTWWWLRSAANETQYQSIRGDAPFQVWEDDATSTYRDKKFRPCLSFDPDTLVTDPDESGICYLLPDPDKPYREAGIENFVLGTQTNMPTQAKIFLTAKGCMTNYPEVEITANFDDSTPVWLPVTMTAGSTDADGFTDYTGIVDFSGVTASQGVKFAVNIYARTESQCRISQPVIAPA